MLIKTVFTTKNRKITGWLLAILGTFFIVAAKYQTGSLQIVEATQSSYKSVIFDLGEVLFTTSSHAKRSLIVPVMFKNPTLFYRLINYDVKYDLFQLLHKVPATSTSPMYNGGKAMPLIMADWMTGTPNKTILDKVNKHIELCDRPNAIKNLFKAIAQLMFEPQTLVDSQTPIEEMVQLAQQLKKAGYKLYVLSNWETESFKILQKQNPNIFNLFDGVLISGPEKMGKPTLEFYARLIEKFKLNSKECIFIDDEPFNTQAAQKLGINSITRTDNIAVIKGLTKLGIFQLKP